MRNVNLFLGLVLMLIGVVVLGLLYGLFQPEEVIDEPGGCGVVIEPYSTWVGNDSINHTIGRQLFSNRCAGCHNRNMKDHLTGPPLLGAIERFNNDTVRFGNFLRNSYEYTLAGDDERIKNLNIEYGNVNRHLGVQLTENEVKSIIVYIEAIYY